MVMESSRAQPPGEGLRSIVSCTWKLSGALAPLVFLAAGCLEPLCSTADIADAGSALGDEAHVGTIPQRNLFESSCNVSGVPEGVFSWVAPASGRYRFDTAGSDLDTVLAVYTGDACDSAELACSDDSFLGFSSQVDLQLAAGESVYVVVEGFWGGTGSFVVNIYQLVEEVCSDRYDDDEDGLIDCEDPDCDCDCPSGMLSPDVDQPVTGTTAGANDINASSCGGAGAPDVSLAWTPPRTGRYLIHTDGSTFDTVLSVQEGDVCGGTELACSYDVFGEGSWVDVVLQGGAPVIITVDGVDGAAGEYVLAIDALSEFYCADGGDDDADGAVDCDDADCDCTCPFQDLGSAVGSGVYAGSTDRHGDLDAGSCGGSGAGDASFVWTAPAAGRYRIDTLNSSFDTVLYVQEGDVCGGAELACNDDTGFGLTSKVEVELAAGQTVLITVDGALWDSGFFFLNITEALNELSCLDGSDDDGDGAIDCNDADCDCTCPADDLGTALGTPVLRGSTEFLRNFASGTCGGADAPDASFVWTAPQDGDYRIHTTGSSFDTLLSVEQGEVCGGDELTCDDDAGGSLTSLVELDLAAGQTMVITVDGFGDSAGSFDLSIECITCE